MFTNEYFSDRVSARTGGEGGSAKCRLLQTGGGGDQKSLKMCRYPLWMAPYLQLTLRQLIQSNLESQFFVRSQLGPTTQSGFSSCAGLHLVTKFTHLSKDCYPQLVLNSHRSKIRLSKHLDCRCMPLHPTLAGSKVIL